MGGNPAATGHWLPGNADEAAIGKLVDPACGGGAWQRIQRRQHPACRVVTGAALEDAVGNAMADDFTVWRPRPQQFRRQTIHPGIAIIADDKPLLGVEHAQALAHVIHRRIQPELLLPQLFLRALKLPLGERELVDDSLEPAGSAGKTAIRHYADETHSE